MAELLASNYDNKILQPIKQLKVKSKSLKKLNFIGESLLNIIQPKPSPNKIKPTKKIEPTNNKSILIPQHYKPIKKLKVEPLFTILYIDSIIHPDYKGNENYNPIYFNSNTVIYTGTRLENLKFKPYLLKERYLSEYKDLESRKKVWENLGLDLYLEANGKSEWGKITGDIKNLKDIQNGSYNNDLVTEITHIKTALDKLIDATFYHLPDDVSVQFLVKCFRENEVVSTVYEGMTITSVECSWKYNNYINNISKVVLNLEELLLPVNNKTLTESHKQIFNINLRVESDYIDSKGKSPKAFNLTKTITFAEKHYYWTSSSDNFTSIPTEKSLIETPKLFDLDMSANTEEQYIYLLLPRTYKNIHIYEQGGADPGGDVTIQLPEQTYTEFDNGVTYLLYRSTNSIKGKWTIKYYN